ncbi:unnamed protein product [Periconia digitata]|uniref:Cation/H+ exchanger transmembrane domain-containing protein n=1 Tax=Periconia digitata TaxID=1303443 RepID=A0A9W4UAV7_9PLEO|nr:unnamed protein product [Periconia digitata]
MPTLDVSELNIVIAVLGAFIITFGIISVKVKQVWYLGEALPAVILGIILGPISAKFLDAEKWGSAVEGQKEAITLGICRVVIGVQLVMAGIQLPAKYIHKNWKEMATLLLPVMTIMWLCTGLCIYITIPKISFLAALVIGSCCTCTDPVLSQAVAKGPFADKYVPRALREIISAEAGGNDGFGFPFLMLATFLIRHADKEGVQFKEGFSAAVTEGAPHLLKRAGDVGRLGGGIPKAIEQWFVEGWFYFILMSIAIGVIVGVFSLFAIKFGLRRKWVDSESFLLWPTAVGLFTLGVCGAIGTDDLLACFVAGTVMNWNGLYLEESLKRHDEVNSCVDILLTFGGFMYIGTIFPWDSFQQPQVTGITVGRLFLLGFLVLVFRRIPAIFMTYQVGLKSCVKSWKEALFMGYFGPIGIGAVFFVEHASHFFPKPEEATTAEEEDLMLAIRPTIYWLVLFSIVVHGLSIPALNLCYEWRGVPPIIEEQPIEVPVFSLNAAAPSNGYVNPKRKSIMVHNRFSRPVSQAPQELYRWHAQNNSEETLKGHV